MQDFIEDGGKKGYVAMYLDILEIYEQSFKEVLMWLREKKTPILFHCTGKFIIPSCFTPLLPPCPKIALLLLTQSI